MWTGLFLSSLALHMAAPASRYVPEPLNFAVQLLRSAAAPGKASSEPPAAAFSASDPSARWLALGPRKWSAANEIQPLELSAVLTKPADDAYFSSPEFKASALAAAIGVVRRTTELFTGASALPEMLAPAQSALEDLCSAEGLPKVQHLLSLACCISSLSCIILVLRLCCTLASSTQC